MKRYASFIVDLHDGLVEALRECEELAFHHEEERSVPFKHYKRVVEMLSHVEERRKWWDDVQASQK